jgi:hypothetical protein
VNPLQPQLGRRIIVEAAWLLAYWALAFLFAGWMLGFRHLSQETLDIQMHNTYFVVPGMLAPLPIFLLEATLVTGIRMLANSRRDPLINGLFTAFVVLLASFLYWLKRVLFH